MKKLLIGLSSLLLVSCAAGYGHQSDFIKKIQKEKLGGIVSPSYILYFDSILDSDLDYIDEKFLPFIEGLSYQELDSYDDLKEYKYCLIEVYYNAKKDKDVRFNYHIYENDIVTLNVDEDSYYASGHKGIYEQVINSIDSYIITEEAV